MATDRDRRKPITAVDMQVLAERAAAKRFGEPTCKNCFVKYPSVNEDGLCPDCAPQTATQKETEDYSGLPQSVQDYIEKAGRTDYKKTVGGPTERTYYLTGPIHSPAYIGSIKANAINDGLEHKTISTPLGSQLIPHPEALGTLPINHTEADYEHYVNARNGSITNFSGGQIDLRTPEQKDPNHRLYLPQPLLGPIPERNESFRAGLVNPEKEYHEGRYGFISNPNDPSLHVEETEGTPAPGKEQRRGRVFEALSSEPNIVTTEHTLRTVPTFQHLHDVMRMNAEKMMSPRDLAEHNANHVTKRRVPARELRAKASHAVNSAGQFVSKVDLSPQYKDPYVRSYPGTIDEKGNFWEEEPSTCHMCNVEHAINDATAEHSTETGHGIAGENPLCKMC